MMRNRRLLARCVDLLVVATTSLVFAAVALSHPHRHWQSPSGQEEQAMASATGSASDVSRPFPAEEESWRPPPFAVLFDADPFGGLMDEPPPRFSTPPPPRF
jgi:hypothetical protein